MWREILPELERRGVKILQDPEAFVGLAATSLADDPTPVAKPMAFGWDFARAQDWTVGIGLDRDYRVVAFHRWQHIPWEEQYQQIMHANGAIPAWGDSTGIGDVIVETLQRRGVPMIAVPFSRPMKQKLMERVKSALQERKLKIPKGPITTELEQFEYDHRPAGVRYSAPSGLHDDCVMALALAVHGRDQFGAMPILEPVGVPDDEHPGFDPDRKRRKPWEPPVPTHDSPWLPSPNIVRLE